MEQSAQHRATADDWAEAGAFATPTRACLMELRARVEALEAGDREDADAWTGVRRAMSELRARVEALEVSGSGGVVADLNRRLSSYSIGDSVDLAKLAYGRVEEVPIQKAEAAQPAEPQSLHSVALQMVDSLGCSFGILPELLDTLRRAIREPIGAESLTDGADAPAPASSLVDAVASVLADANAGPPDIWRPEAKQAALIVADWLEKRPMCLIHYGKGWSDLIRREVQESE